MPKQKKPYFRQNSAMKEHIEFLKIGIYSSLIFIILSGIEFVYTRFKTETEYTRKAAHFLCGLISLSLAVYMNSVWSVLVLSILFLIALLYSKKSGILKSVNGIKRYSVGSTLYPVSIFICFFVFKLTGNINYFYIPLLLLIICDPLAALTGQYFPIKKFNFSPEEKTVGGTIAFLFSSVLVIFFYQKIKCEKTDIDLLVDLPILAIGATITEVLSVKGTDNILVPIVGIITLFGLGFI